MSGFDSDLESVAPRGPRSVKQLPGLAWKRRISASQVALPLLFLVGFSLLPLSILFETDARFDREDTRILNAEVLSVQPVCSRNCPDSASRLLLNYSVDASDFEASKTVCTGDVYADSKAGDTVPLTYLIEEPQINRIAIEKTNAPPYFAVLIFPLVAVPFFLLMFAPGSFREIAQLARHRRLFRAGVRVDGELLFVGTPPVSGFLSSQRPVGPDRLYVRYVSPSGEPHEGSVLLRNPWLVQQLTPGSRLNVVMDEARPEKFMLLEPYLR